VRSIRSTTISILAAGLLAGSAVAVAAQDEEYPPLVYFTGSLGDPGRFVEPDVIAGDLGWKMRGLEVYDVPFEVSDPRLSGNLSGFGQGNGGGPFGDEGGFVNFDSYSMRIDNDGGAWVGDGGYFWVTDGEEAQVDIYTMSFTGTGGYEGLWAYAFVDQQADPSIRGIITSLEPAPVPDPVPAPAE
jgi:hypothetical protein